MDPTTALLLLLTLACAVGLVALIRRLKPPQRDFEPVYLHELILGILIFLAAISVFAAFFLPADAGQENRYSVLVVGLAYIPAAALTITMLCRGRDPAPTLGLGRVNFVACAVVTASVAILFFLPVTAIGGVWQALLLDFGIEPKVQPTIEALRNEPDALLKCTTVLMAVSVVPFAEEFVFRGLLYAFLRGFFSVLFARFRPGTQPAGIRSQVAAVTFAVLLSSFAFAMIHYKPHDTGPIFAVGVVLALLYERTRSLYYPIAFHAWFNASQLFAAHLLMDL